MDTLPEHLDLIYAQTFLQHVNDHFGRKKNIIIDLSNVERSSLSCIQILVSAQKKANEKNKVLSIIASPELEKTFNLLGLSKHLTIEGTA